MAEYVFQNVESMLPELEEMERLELFTKDEIKCIVKRRTAFEYKLQRRIAQETDFLRYIQYELNLDLLRKRRKKQHAIQEKKLPSEVVFIRRLHCLFQSAIKKFPSDVKLWLQYIEFCKQTGSFQALGKVTGRMLQAHPHNTSLWITAAKYEFEDRNNVKTARSLLQRALRINPKIPSLWLEYFRLELLYVDKVKKRRKLLGMDAENKEDTDEPTSSDFIAGKTASIVYKNAIQNISDDVEFRLKFVNIYCLFDDSDEGIDEVYQSLSNDFPDCEEAWNALACRGLHKAKLKTVKMSDSEMLELESERNAVFEEALKKLQTEKMWSYYINACLVELERYSDSALQKRVDQVLKLFKAAEKVKKLSEEKYLSWIKTLQKNGGLKEAVSVCRTALKVFPNSVPLWQQNFTLHLIDLKGSTTEFLNEFCETLSQLTSDHDVMKMWSFWLELSMSHESSKETQRVYDRCIELCSDSEVVAKVNESYLELVVLKDGIQKARKFFKRMCKENSVSLSFYKTLLHVEQSQATPSVKYLRKLFETAVGNFGSHCSDLWLDYIKLELENGNSDMVSKLHWRAMKALSSGNVEEFVTKYTLLQHS